MKALQMVASDKSVVYRTRLKELREEKGLERMDIVYGARMTYQTIAKWESEPLQSIRADNVQAICSVLGCTPEELIYISEE